MKIEGITRDMENKKFHTDANGYLAVNVTGDTTGTITAENAKKAALLGASDLEKIFAYDVDGNLSTITHSSISTDAHYTETIILTKTFTYTVGNLTEIQEVLEIT